MAGAPIAAKAAVPRPIPVALDDLPRTHPGGMILDRCFRRQTERRDRSAVAGEYEEDKYAQALAFAKSAGVNVAPFDVRMFEFGHARGEDWCFSEGERLFRAPLADVQTRFDALFVNRLEDAARGCRSIVELGCGYGYHLYQASRAMPERVYLGGDIAPTALRLAELLYSRGVPIRVAEFDYYAEDYSLLDQVEGPILVFTYHSIEQIPAAAGILKALARKAASIARVLHFEPIYESHGESLLGRLRRAYADSVDYNRDLLGLLKANPAVKIARIEPNLYGINPLNPTTIIEWAFR